MPSISGAQGCGKSFFVEVFSAILGIYALPNVDDMDKVFGKFNSLIARHLLININESPDSEGKFKYNNKIKTLTTQANTIQGSKGIDQIEIKCYANFMITTNNKNAVTFEKGDRRNIHFVCNSKYCGNQEYFNQLCKPWQSQKQGPYDPELMGLLLHYMKTQIDTSDYDAELLIRKISTNTQTDHNEQLEAQYTDLNAVDRYVVDNIEKFEKGIYMDEIKIEGYGINGIARKLNTICTAKRVNIKITDEIINKKTRYTIKSREEIPDLFAIIEYKKYQNGQAEEEQPQLEFLQIDLI
jgi:hypothetical protein